MHWTCFSNYATVFIGLSVLILFYYFLKRPKNFPPGPHGLPLVGYIPFLEKNMAEGLRKLKDKYGSVMAVQFGRDDCVVLNSYDSINEALVKQGEKFSGRTNNYIFDLVTIYGGFKATDYGPTWRALKKLGHRTLRGLGVGKTALEATITEETPFLVENFTTKNGQTSQMKLTIAVSNNISKIAFGSRFEYDDKIFLHMVEIIQKFSEDTPHSNMLAVLTFAPILRFIPPFRNVVKITSDDAQSFMGYVQDIIEEHESSFDEHHIRDFTDAFLIEIKKSGKGDPAFNKLQLIQYIRDLFDAGSVTTSSTLTWTLLCFCHYPECQEKIAAEVAKAIGEDRIPSMRHRDEMPYTCAFIQELMRHRTLVPLSIFHKTNKEATLNGYTIPKNTTIAPNLWAVHYDPEYFENPREFRPERFLDRDGKFITSNHVIPFSIGPRRCLGEQLARMQIFLFLTGIVQKLKVLPDPDNPPPSFHIGGSSIVTYEPPVFDVVFERR
uniref:cytochrome P450 2U1-like n=1 Tax=Styela clava TaxID=7725 RepID=UPI00193980EB|nr:cytochrome P450 2U1-like [Styela clava]